MPDLTLDIAKQIVSGAIKHAREINAAPICVAVLDIRGIVRPLQPEDGYALLQPDIAQGKAWGSIGLSKQMIDRQLLECHITNPANPGRLMLACGSNPK
jgi:uncharacterized protein GlcG (DUF336 family)